jgi:rod shape-determining protein MreC
MRNLFLFLAKNYYFFLCLFLESLSVFLLVQYNTYQHAGFINSSNAIAGSVYESWTGMTGYFGLRHSNELLAEENAQLHNKLKNAYADYTIRSKQLTDTVYKQKYSYIAAKVVNNTTNRRNNYLTLDRGAAQGIKSGMAVVCSEGVVGIVANVSENYATVRSLLHKDINIPSMIRKYGENTILFWDGDDYRFGRMENVPSHLKLLKGDTIVTSAYSSIFPEGVLVGTVEEVMPIQGNTFNNVRVRFSTDFRKLSYVYIVNNMMHDEQETLEKQSQAKDKE